jgi:soluble lytic murein transglycosylase-like protein
VSSHGRLVRTVVAPALRSENGRSRAELLRQAARVDELVNAAAVKHAVDPLLIHAVIQAESNYDPFAISVKGAEGLMQLIPPTARRFGVGNAFDPEQNIDAGVRYLKYLQDLFQDDRLAIAAYNAGEGAIVRHQWIPPYPETREYVRRVAGKYAELKKQAEKTTEGGAPEEDGPKYRPVESFIDSEGRLHLRTR